MKFKLIFCFKSDLVKEIFIFDFYNNQKNNEIKLVLELFSSQNINHY